ncbi:MAG TPA: methyltransferase [Kribbella sp.]|nr:methyltransferase [Kribbella sp.]
MPDPVDLEGLLDLATPWCLRVVVTLHVAEHLTAEGKSVNQLATAVGCDAAALQDVLSHLASKGVFAEPEPGVFALNDAAERLRDQAAYLDLEGLGGRLAAAWSTLPVYVRTGRPGYEGLFGRPFWEDLAAHPKLSADFDAMMGPAGHGVPDEIELSTGWDVVRTVVDVGGGTGAMLARLLELHPHLKATLVDLPATVARADLEGAEKVGQSFFEPLPAGADVYLLRHVLNDWPDAETVAILRRCAEAAGDTGRVVVAGGVVRTSVGRELTPEAVLLGGRSNTVAEFRQLARQAGLEVVAVNADASAVECVAISREASAPSAPGRDRAGRRG